MKKIVILVTFVSLIMSCKKENSNSNNNNNNVPNIIYKNINISLAAVGEDYSTTRDIPIAKPTNVSDYPTIYFTYRHDNLAYFYFFQFDGGYVSFGYTGSGFNAKTYTLGEEINSSSSNYTDAGPGNTTVYGYSYDSIGNTHRGEIKPGFGDKYVGFRIKDSDPYSNSFDYGWLLVNYIDERNIIIKEMAYNKSGSIKAGQK